MRRAVIDIGTNTVKLLVADVANGEVVPVVHKDLTTRLGEGVNATRRLSSIAVERTVQCVSDFLADARGLGAADVMAFTTSAVRGAANQEEFLSQLRKRCGLEVEVITGEREAELIFHGVCSDPIWARERLLVMDIGGGSVEFIQGERGKIERLKSLPLGAVRMTEQFGEKHFSELAEFLRTTFFREFKEFSVSNRRMVVTGGANTTLVKVAKGKIDHAALTMEEVGALLTKLNAMSLEERKLVPGMPADRADIIVAGAAVLFFAMEMLGAMQVSVSVRNLRYGALLEEGRGI